jgi:hypothetical protein
MTVGLSLGHVSLEAVSLISAVGIATISLSSYFILHGDQIYKIIEPYLSRLFPQKSHDPYVVNKEILKDHAILVGAEQMGWDILELLRHRIAKEQIVVVDFNPEITTTLSASGYNAVFGDISDPEVLGELELNRAKILIITDPDISDNNMIIKFAKEKNYKGPIITTAYWIHDAIKLYESGADYVVVPETVGGKHIAKMLSEHWDNLAAIKKHKSKNFEELMRNKVF